MNASHREVQIPVNEVVLTGDLQIPPVAVGLVLFVHGSGSSRLSSRNRFVADQLNQRNLATLLFDLLSPEEQRLDLSTGAMRFDIGLLVDRVDGATRWLRGEPALDTLSLGYFGASTGAAAALAAGIRHPTSVKAIVSRGGRPDLAGDALPRVSAPTLLIVGSLDTQVIELNRTAQRELLCESNLDIVEGASHLFEEPGKLEIVAGLAAAWFGSHLCS
jgi:putative phosphoribosyl transferase